MDATESIQATAELQVSLSWLRRHLLRTSIPTVSLIGVQHLHSDHTTEEFEWLAEQIEVWDKRLRVLYDAKLRVFIFVNKGHAGQAQNFIVYRSRA